MKSHFSTNILSCLILVFIMSCYDPPRLGPYADIQLRNETETIGNPTSFLEWSHTIAPGDNRLLLVSIAKRSNISNILNTVTYGGMALTKLAEVQAAIYDKPQAEFWYLLAPPIGTASIIATLSSGVDYWVASGMDFIGINQTVPFGAPVSASGMTDQPQVTVSSTPDNMIIDVLAYFHGSQFAAVAPNQTQQWDLYADSNWKGKGSTKAGDSSVTMAWNITWENGFEGWAQIAVALQPAPLFQ